MPVSDQTPNVVIVDSSENLMEVSGGQPISNGTKGFLAVGVQSNGTASYLSLDSAGILRVTGSISQTGTYTVTGSVTVPNTLTITGSVGVANFPATQSVTGTVGISGIPTITGSITVANQVSVTGSIAVTNTPVVTGSVSVLNTVVITDRTQAGSGTLAPFTGSLVGGKDTSGNFQPFATTTGGFLFVSGNVSASIVGTPTVTGSITVPNTVTVTGSVGISGTPTVTGSVSVLNTVNTTFTDPAEGVTGSTPPSRAIFIGGYDAGSVVMRALSVDATGKLNVNATAAGSPNVGGTGSAAPTTASLGGAVDNSGILRPILSDNSGRQIIQTFNTASITGSVALSQTATVTGSITVPNTVTVTGSVGLAGIGTSVVGGFTALKVDVVQTVGGSTSASSSSVGRIDGVAPVSGTLIAATDKSGSLQQLRTDISGAIIAEDILLALARGDISGSQGFAYGTASISATTETAIRQNTYTEQTTNAQRSVKSSAAGDAAAGTGGRRVRLTYYDQNGAGPFTEDISLNGTTAVATVSTTIAYVESLEFIEYGSAGAAAGAITLHSNNAGGGTTILTLALGTTKNLHGYHYTNKNKRCFIVGLNVAGAANGRFVLRAKAPGGTNGRILANIRSGTNISVQKQFIPPLPVPLGFQQVQLFWAGDATGATIVAGNFEWIEVD